ncbi:MAG TPA: DNA translocase FtsK 4TM domain-containing protein, partial [Acidimicrobiales bacterium]
MTKTRRPAPTRASARTARTSKKPAARAKRAAPAKSAKPRFWKVQARDLCAVGLITLGVLLALALWGQQLGPVGHGTNSGLSLLAGWTRVLLPLLAVGAGVDLLVDREDPDEETEGADPWRLAVGSVLGVLGICGLAELAKGSPSLHASHDLREAGGYLGALVGRPLHAGLGGAGAAVLLVAVVLVALLVGTGVPLASVGRAVRTGGAATGRTLRSAWRGKPIVVTTIADAPLEEDEVTSSAPPPIDAEASDPSDARDDADIDIPLDPEPALDAAPRPEPEPEPEVALPLVSAHRGPGEWVLPSLSLLHASKKLRLDQRQVDAAGADLVAALAAHGVDTRLVGSRVGPTVTRYELELGPGVKVARVTSLSKDIAYAMASPDVRILAPIPGKSAIGVEVPNRTRQLVSLRDILESKEAAEATHPLEVAMGRDIAGRAVLTNLAEMPHILISGATGSGKSSCINSIITSVLMRDTPDKVKL